MTAVQSQPELLSGVGKDGVVYAIRPFEWSLGLAAAYYERFAKMGLLADHMPRNLSSFLQTMPGSIWFEMVEAKDGKNVGFVYLTDLAPSLTEKRYLSATFHAVAWDSKASPRIELVRRFIAILFRMFRLHRMQAVIPMNRGGAIRMAKKLGFKPEGVMRDAVSYRGIWFSTLLLSLLEGEVENGTGAAKANNS